MLLQQINQSINQKKYMKNMHFSFLSFQPSLQENASSLTGQECSFLFPRTFPTVDSTSVNSVVTNRESNECQPSLQENTSTVTGQQCSFSSPTGEGISEVDSVVTSLQQIFPSKSREELVEITRSSSTLEEATNKLLDSMHAENPFQQRGTKIPKQINCTKVQYTCMTAMLNSSLYLQPT